MKARVITTITSMIDLDSFETEHSVDISDEDGLSDISADVIYSLVLGSLNATKNTILKRNPHLTRADERTDTEEQK